MNIKKLFSIGWKFLTNSDYRFSLKASRGLCDGMPDEEYLRRLFKARVGYSLNLEDPKTFNEKLQWLKLYDRNPDYSRMVDKFEVKAYVTEKLGAEYVIPTLGVWDCFDEIDFSLLPEKFVLKCTHDSGGLVICRDKSKLDLNSAKQKITRSLQRSYFYVGREWPYKQVRPRIIAEQYVEENETGELKDYKLMCFNGEVRCSFICAGRGTPEGLHITFFDRQWNTMPFKRHYPNIRHAVPKPDSYDEMVALAEKLSQGIPFVRIDFYEIKGKVYFGEMTFYPGNGFEEFEPVDWDHTLGSWIKLPEKQ